MLRRRTFCATAALGAASLLAPRALAKKPAAPPPIPAMALSIALGAEEGAPVAGEEWLALQVSEAKRLLTPHGIELDVLRQRALGSEHARLEDAAARDAVAGLVEEHVINVFIVATLRDIDDPELLRQGVRWRMRRNVSKDCVIVAASAGRHTLAHELGHFFGNGHSDVVDNVMSYEHRDPDKVAFDRFQGIRMRQVARQLLAAGKLRPLSVLREEG